MKPRVPYDPAAFRRPSLEAVGGPAKRGCDAQEERIAQTTPGGARVRGSGCSTRPGRKSDVVGELTRVEGKTTEAESFTVQRAWLTKITAEAQETGLRPAFTFGFDGPPREDWKAYPLAFAGLLEAVVVKVLAGDIEGAREAAARVPARVGG